MNFIKKIFSPLVALLFGLTPILWFWGRTDILINGNDTNFPLNPITWFTRRLYIWNGGLNGGQDAATTPGGLFFHGLQALFFQPTNSLQLTQLITFIFWFTAIPLSFYIFLRLVFKKFNPLAAIVGMTLYTYNIYLFNTWENSKVANLALVVGLPALLGLFIYSLREGISKKILVGVAIVGFITAGSGINPAYFLVFVLVLSLYLLFMLLSDISRKESSLFLIHLSSAFKFFTVLFLTNLFWILPLLNKFFFVGSGTITDISQLGLVNWLRDLSQNTTVFNILRLQGAWDWYSFDDNTPLYIPYAPVYFSHPFFIVFSLLIPFLVFISLLIIRRERNLTLFFAVLFVLGIFFGVGANGTLGIIYLWLATNVPFFSFFRSPWYVFTPLITLSAAVLIFLIFEQWFLRAKWLALSAAVLLVIGNLFYSYPLITGEIFRPTKRDNTFMLVIPDYVFQTRDWLASLGDGGRILSFPNTPIERFTWGYSGLDSILQLISDEDVIYPSFGVIKKDAIDVLQERMHKAIKDSNLKDASLLASLFSVSRFFVKGDVVLPMGVTANFNPDYAFIEKNPKVFGPWEFYRLQENYTLPRIYVPKKIFKVDGDLAAVADARVSENQLLSAFFYAPQIGSKVFFEENVTEKVFQVRNGELENFKAEIQYLERIEDENIRHREKYFDRARFDPFKVLYTVTVDEDGDYELLIRDFYIEGFGLKLQEDWEAVLNGEKIKLTPRSRSEGWIYFESLFLNQGQNHLEIILPENPNLIKDGLFEEGEWLGNKGISLSEDARDGKYALELTATIEEAWVKKPINNFSPESTYLLSVDYKREFGPRPNITIVQKSGPHTPWVQKELLSLSKEWVFYETLFRGEDISSTAEIGIFADGNVEEGTRHLYDNLSFRRIFSNIGIFRKTVRPNVDDLPQITSKKVNPTKYEVKVRDARQPFFIVFSETFNLGWNLYLDGNKIDSEKHLIANGYANSWFVEKMGSYEATIEYVPQRLFIAGLAISGATVLSSIGFLIYNFLKRRRNET